MLSRAAKDFVFRFPHRRRSGWRFVVKPVQMQKTMHNVELDLPRQRITELASVPSCGFDTDENFAVMKSDNVSRPGFAEKLAVQA